MVPDRVAASAGGVDAGVAEVPGASAVEAGQVVEPQPCSACRQASITGVVPCLDVGVPGGGGGEQRVPPILVMVDPTVGGIERHGLGDVSGLQSLKRSPFGWVESRRRLLGGCDPAAWRVVRASRSLAGSDGAELVVVADHDHFGAGGVRRR